MFAHFTGQRRAALFLATFLMSSLAVAAAAGPGAAQARLLVSMTYA